MCIRDSCHDDIVNTMKHYGMRPLEHEVDTLRKDGQQIIIAGVRNPFDLGRNGVSPTLALSPKDFVILLVHTPDYIEDVSVANTDLALAGHTHGGQVRVFGVAPALNSHSVSYTHLRAHETDSYLVCRLLLEKKKKKH